MGAPPAAEGLRLGIRHPAKVKKIAAMAANLNPTKEALSPEVLALAKSMLHSIPAAAKETPQGKRELKAIQMALFPDSEPSFRSLIVTFTSPMCWNRRSGYLPRKRVLQTRITASDPISR
jgi:hypothetical protein